MASKPTMVNIDTTVPTFDTNAIAAGAEQWQQQHADKVQAAANFSKQYGATQGADLPEIYQSTKQPSTGDGGSQYKAYRVENTIGGNNYYLPNGQLTTQGQYNSLNGTGHVAGMPEQLGGGLDYSQMQSTGKYTPENTATAEEATAPTKTSAKTAVSTTKGTGISTPQTEENPNAVYDENGNYLGSADIVYGGQTSNTEQTEEQQTDNNNEQALTNMENDLQQQGGTIYGKITSDEGIPTNGINTLTDPYSAQAATNKSRIANLKYLQNMNSEDIATSISAGYTPYGDQAMRDLMQYNPEKYAEVQQYLKQIKGQNDINSITSGNISGMNTTKAAVSNVNSGVDSWADSISSSPQQAGQLVTNVSNTMSNNGVATTATQEMLNLNAQMAEIEEKMNNVTKEAQKAFKGDVPQYIVSAYANNRLQEYQSEYNKLESRYNAAMDLYKTELSNAQWQEEMDLKKAEFNQKVSNEERDRHYKSQQLLQNNIKRVNGAAYQVDPTTGTYVKLTDQTATLAYQSDVDELMQGWTSMFYDGQYVGYQCEQFTDNFTEASVGIRMTGADGRSWTTAAEKLSYVNDVTPAVGSVIVTAGGAYDSTYGHTMLITGYDPTTGLMNLMWANSDGDNTIHTSTTTLDAIRRNSQAMGIRNPYKTKVEQSIQEGGYAGGYSWANTPMTAIIDQYKESAGTSGERDNVAKAERMYNTMYEIINDGSLDELVYSDGFAELLSDIKNTSFSSTDEGEKLSKMISKAIKNKGMEAFGGEGAYNALLKLQGLVEMKLRKESGAAISSSERRSNFSMLLPNAGESYATRMNKLKTWDNIIYTNFASAGMKGNEYIPLFGSTTTTREIR